MHLLLHNCRKRLQPRQLPPPHQPQKKGNCLIIEGLSSELSDLENVLRRGRWFFARITGRRRIEKTTLVQEALRAAGAQSVLYVQIPNSSPTGVLSAVVDAMEIFGIPASFECPTHLRALVVLVEALARAGYVVTLDEFQYFSRSGFYEFRQTGQGTILNCCLERGSTKVAPSLNSSSKRWLIENVRPWLILC